MRTTVFAHKGLIGIQSAPDAEGMLNKPLDPGQFGFVVDASYVDVSPEALELLKRIPKSDDALGDIDVFKADDGKVIFGWIGSPMTVVDPATVVSGSRDYDATLLTANPKVITEPGFIEFVDSLSKETK